MSYGSRSLRNHGVCRKKQGGSRDHPKMTKTGGTREQCHVIYFPVPTEWKPKAKHS
jgi:hypothetical protein